MTMTHFRQELRLHDEDIPSFKTANKTCQRPSFGHRSGYQSRCGIRTKYFTNFFFARIGQSLEVILIHA